MLVGQWNHLSSGRKHSEQHLHIRHFCMHSARAWGKNCKCYRWHIIYQPMPMPLSLHFYPKWRLSKVTVEMFSSTATIGSGCTSPFLQYTFGCLYLDINYRDWCTSREHCIELGADIWSPDSDQKFADLRTNFSVTYKCMFQTWFNLHLIIICYSIFYDVIKVYFQL